MKAIHCFVAACLLIVLSGCQEIQGPVWSGDGQYIAHTVYARRGDGGFGTSVYLSSPDAEDPAPKLLADAAAFPQWISIGAQLYFLGARDAQGFYTKILFWKPGQEKPKVVLDGVRLTAMQLATGRGGPILLLSQGRDAQPGSPVRTELFSASDNKRTDLSPLGEMYGPALSFNGKMLVYGTKPAEGHAILMATDVDGEPKAVFPTEATPEPGVAGFVVHAFPNTERFLFYGPGMNSVWVMSGRPGENKFVRHPIPEGLAGPVMARVAEDSNSALLTLLHATPGKISYESYRLEFASSRWAKLDGNADEPIGGAALDPNWKKGQPLRVASLSAAGLSLGDPAKPQFWPVTADQHIAASAWLLKKNDPVRALEAALKAQDVKPPPSNPDALDQALYTAYMANKHFDRAAEICEQAWLLEPVKPAGLRYLFPPDSGLALPPADWVVAETKRFDEIIAAAPQNRMLPILKEAFQARLKGEQRAAIETYRKALALCGDKACMGGMYFLQGMCAVEMSDPQQAGEFFEQAARIDDFPQADYAAALSAMAYLLSGRENGAKANAMLQLPIAKKSPFAAEFASLESIVRDKAFKERITGKQDVSAGGLARAWVVADNYCVPYAAAKPARMEVGAGTFAERHIGPARMTASEIHTDKSTLPILRVARPVTAPKLSPSGAALAFTVSGEVFPAPDNYCDLVVMDLAGGVYAGNTLGATAGKTKGRQIFNQFAWNGNSEIKASGVEVDVFGMQRPFEKVVPVGRLGNVRKAQ